MALEVRWSGEAEFTFDNIYGLIAERGGIASANKFKNKTLRMLSNITKQPYLFPESGIGQVRKAVISKQTSVFYEIYDDRIQLLFFWDNRQAPLFV